MKKESTREYHPFEPFLPEGCTSLLLGSFPGARSTGRDSPVDHWYYSAPRNQFWPIMRMLFPKRTLESRFQKMQLFTDIGMAVTDIILSCERRRGSNLDGNLTGRVYNIEAVESILDRWPIERVLFTGRGVRKSFERFFKCGDSVDLVDLPSPSPAFFRMSFPDKVSEWRNTFLTQGLLKPY